MRLLNPLFHGVFGKKRPKRLHGMKELALRKKERRDRKDCKSGFTSGKLGFFTDKYSRDSDENKAGCGSRKTCAF
jgi:hypothetical protein